MKYENFKRAGQIQQRIDYLQQFLGSKFFEGYPVSEEAQKKVLEILTDDIRSQVNALRDEFDAL